MNYKIFTHKNLLASFIFCGLSFMFAEAQTCTPSIISTTGDFYANASGSVSFTIGEPIIETYSDPSNILTQGFQQTDYSFVGIKNIVSTKVEVNVYPNPFSSEFTINNTGDKQLYAEITDMTGKTICKMNLTSGLNEINPGNLSASLYILRIYDSSGSEVQAFKMIKNK